MTLARAVGYRRARTTDIGGAPADDEPPRRSQILALAGPYSFDGGDGCENALGDGVERPSTCPGS
jgi:hypothetical protein